MSVKRKKYSKQFKLDALQMYEKGTKSLSQVAYGRHLFRERHYESLIRKSIFCHFAVFPFDIIIGRQN